MNRQAFSQATSQHRLYYFKVVFTWIWAFQFWGHSCEIQQVSLPGGARSWFQPSWRVRDAPVSNLPPAVTFAFLQTHAERRSLTFMESQSTLPTSDDHEVRNVSNVFGILVFASAPLFVDESENHTSTPVVMPCDQPIFHMVWRPDGKVIATAGWSHDFVEKTVSGDKVQIRVTTSYIGSEMLASASFRVRLLRKIAVWGLWPDGALLAVGSAGKNEKVTLYDTRTHRVTKSINIEGSVRKVAFSPEKAQLAIGGLSPPSEFPQIAESDIGWRIVHWRSLVDRVLCRRRQRRSEGARVSDAGCRSRKRTV